MSGDMNERPEGFRDTLCPVDTHPCEGQGTDADCRACLTKARLEADLRGAQLLMVSSELAGDPKMDHADRSDPRWTPTLHEAWCARQKHKENERLLSSVEGYRRDIDNCLAELKHKNKVLRDREREPAPQPGARELYAAWAQGAEAAICTFASDERPPSGPEVDRFYAKNPYENRPSTPKGSGQDE